MHLLILAGSLALGFLTAAAQTWCLFAIEKRNAWGHMWWDVVISVSSLAVIYTHDWMAYATYIIGSAWASYWTIKREKGKVVCDRCKQTIKGSVLPDSSGMTAGYYDVVSGCWAKFSMAGERYICDGCMWKHPGYIKVYGTHSVT